MADKKPTDLIKVFIVDKFNLEDEVNEWLEDNPEYYLDQMKLVKDDSPSHYVTLVCDFCLREDLDKEESEKDTSLTEELLKGLIGAVNELTDTVKELTNKKENI